MRWRQFWQFLLWSCELINFSLVGSVSTAHFLTLFLLHSGISFVAGHVSTLALFLTVLTMFSGILSSGTGLGWPWHFLIFRRNLFLLQNLMPLCPVHGSGCEFNTLLSWSFWLPEIRSWIFCFDSKSGVLIWHCSGIKIRIQFWGVKLGLN